VAPGSDLFQEVEKENVLLKQKLEMLQADQQKAAGAVEKQRELEAELARAKAGEQQSREAVEKLLERIPELEDQLAALKSGTQQQDAAITVKDKDLSAFKLELERRENRLIKAERMATLLAKTREEIKQVSDREKRDMHYNMAAVYAKEGKYREAEQEYLRALRIDPGDADSHYNLGILYDEQLADKRRAAMHYRRYLKLRPNASDGDIVKTWLMDLDMGRR
jgi:tetratricopeptide (TPR) repeat protein